MEEAPGEKLRQARRALDGLLGVEEIGDWFWNAEESRWALSIKIRHGASSTKLIPEVTGWIIVPDDENLFGSIEVYPAPDFGITTTFPHQRFNGVDPRFKRYTGRPCLTNPSYRLKRNSGQEPVEGSERMIWRVNRLLEWLNDAENGYLAIEGEPFELPDFPGADHFKTTVAFQETPGNILKWSQAPHHGIANILLSRKIVLVREFEIQKNSTVTTIPSEWGEIGHRVNVSDAAIWIRLDNVPVDSPWRAPSTVGELASVLAKEGLDLRAILSINANKRPELLRKGRPLLALIGFPIPKSIGGSVHSYHWQGVLLPAVCPQNSRGFRNNPDSMTLCDVMRPISDMAKLEWRNSENWAEENLKTRGSFSGHSSEDKVVIFGVGALGSTIAELLARGGFNDFILIDPDIFHAGNGVRHILSLPDIGSNKADAIANRLKLIRPQIKVQAITKHSFSLNSDDLASIHDSILIIDATGNDEMLSWSESFLRTSQATFVSLSFSYAAKRLFCFASSCADFSVRMFRDKISPWLAYENSQRSQDEALPRESVGCWSVVFPARADDVWLLASAGVKWIDRLPSLISQDESVFDVFEQYDENGSFSGLRKGRLPSVTD